MGSMVSSCSFYRMFVNSCGTPQSAMREQPVRDWDQGMFTDVPLFLLLSLHIVLMSRLTSHHHSLTLVEKSRGCWNAHETRFEPHSATDDRRADYHHHLTA